MNYVSKIAVAGALLLTTTFNVHAAPTMQDTQNSANNMQQGTDDSQTHSSLQSGSQDAQISSSNQHVPGVKNKNAPTIVTADNLHWTNVPNMLPSGAQFVILDGNPKNTGNVTFRFKLPANYQLPPAYSQGVDRITVLSGTLNIGTGDKLDTSKGTSLPAGSYVLVPAKLHHYIWASEDSIIQVSSMGPWTVKYVNAKDDPRNKGSNPSQAAGQNPTSESHESNPNATSNQSSQPSGY
jgi:hypothetical protein